MTPPAEHVPTGPKVMLWVQHLMGIGHQRRAACIARALSERGAAVAYVTGGASVPGLDVGGARVVALPAARVADVRYGGLVDLDGRAIDDTWRAARRDRLLAAFDGHAPQVLVTETYPFGRRLLRFELLPLVERARATGCRLVSSIRDVLQPPSSPSRARAAADRVRESYDAVLVHGDPTFVTLDASFPEADRIREHIRYTGYVATGQGPEAPPGVGNEEIVVSAGGGAVAHRLVDTALETARLVPGMRWRILVGPNAGADALTRWRRSAGPNARVEPNRADFRSILSRARASVSQAGYNTVTDILATGVRAVLVPFSAGVEREQTIRARMLERAGAARVIDEDRLTAEALLVAVRSADAPAVQRRRIRLDGARESADIILEIARAVLDPSGR